MSFKTTRVETTEETSIGRQWGLFSGTLIFCALFSWLTLFLIENEIHAVLTGTAVIFWIFGVYLMPSILAYDLTSYYQESYSAPHIKNPNAFVILLLNLTLGWTLLVWVLCLFLSVKPGKVKYTKVEYKQVG